MKTIIFALLCLCMLAFTVTAQQTASGCDVCQFFVHQLEEQAYKYEGVITAQFKKQVCGKLNALEAPCGKFVDAYGPVAIKYLINKFDKFQVCHKIKLCKSNAWIQDIFTAEEAFAIFQQMQSMAVEEHEPVFSVNETPYCGICEFAIESLAGYINASESEIEQAALKLCKKIPAQYEQICDTMVLMYLPNIIEQLLEKIPPHKACCKITLCRDNCNATSIPIEPKKEEKIAVVTPAVVEVSEQSNDAGCSMCQFMVSQVQNYLKQNATQETIKREVSLLCAKLSDKYAKTCNNIAEQWIPYIVYYIEQNFSPEKVCQLIGVCSTQRHVPAMTSLPVVADAKVADSGCTMCTLAMTMLQQYINANSTDEQIKQQLKGLCTKLPENFVPICVNLVDIYEPVLIEQIRKYIAEHKLTDICQTIGMCPAKKQVNPFVLTSTQKLELAINENGKFCGPCLAVVSLAQQQLSSDATRQMIKEKLNSLCDEIPSEQIAGLCKIVVAGKTDELIDGILARATPSEVCSFAGLCAKKQIVFLKNGSPLTCGVCKEVVNVAVNYITSESTIAQIKDVLENVVCKKLPGSFENICQMYVEQYASELIDALKKGILNSDYVCQIVGACQKKASFGMRQNRIRVN